MKRNKGLTKTEEKIILACRERRVRISNQTSTPTTGNLNINNRKTKELHKVYSEILVTDHCKETGNNVFADEVIAHNECLSRGRRVHSEQYPKHYFKNSKN